MKELDVPAKLGNVSIGKKTVRLGFIIPREELKLSLADHFFADSQLRLNLQEDDGEQASLPGVERPILRGVADVKGYRVTSAEISAGMTFNRNEVNIDELAAYAQKAVAFKAERVGSARDSADESDHLEDGDPGEQPGMFDGAEDEDANAEPNPDGWRRADVRLLVSHDVPQTVVVKLADAGFTTLGDMAERDHEWRQLDGIGPKTAERIDAARQAWMAKHPSQCPPVRGAA